MTATTAPTETPAPLPTVAPPTEPSGNRATWPVDVTLREKAVLFALGAAGVPSDLWAEFASVAWCESRWLPDATGASGERGLFQLHPIHDAWLIANGWSPEQMYDPVGNARAAYRIWLSEGWTPWSCAPS